MADSVPAAAGRLAPYVAVVRARIRAQRSYRTSFRIDLLGSAAIGVIEFGEVWIVVHSVGTLGGLNVRAILLLFGLSNLAFASGNLIAGHLDQIPTYIRAGTLDTFYLRPQPLLAQLLISDFQLRRLARMTAATTVLVVGFGLNDIVWDVRTVAVITMAVTFGTAIFAGLFVCAAGLQFYLINGAELTNAFTYGGAYAAGQPASVFTRPLTLFFGYLVPVVFTGYLPTVAILRLDSPPGLPSWLVWCTPLAALWVWAVALLLWRLGVRHYQGGGG